MSEVETIQLHVTITVSRSNSDAAFEAIREGVEERYPWVLGVDLDGVTR